MTKPEIFIPDPSAREHDQFHLTIHPSDHFGVNAPSADRWEITIWSGHHGNSLGVPIRGKEVALALARSIYNALVDEYKTFREEEHRAMLEWEKREDVRRAARRKAEDKERKRKLKIITPKTKAETLYQCPHCGALAELEDYDVPTYTCTGCGTEFRRDEENGHRCPECHKFGAKEEERSCPSCEQGLDSDELTAVDGYLIEGEFIPLSEVP